MSPGPKGDKGDRGDAGPRGAEGVEGHQGVVGDTAPITQRTVVILFLVTAALIVALSWMGERNSCERQSGVRDSARLFADTAYTARTAAAQLDMKKGDHAQYAIDHKAAVAYARSKQQARALRCEKILPDTH